MSADILHLFDAVVLDIGGTLVVEAAPATPTEQLSVQLLPRVLDDLAVLARHVRLAAATNTTVLTEDDVRALLEPSGVAGYLEAIVTSVDVGAAKPDPAVLRVALERLGGVDPQRALYIGDRRSDELAARAIGMAFASAHPDGLQIGRAHV